MIHGYRPCTFGLMLAILAFSIFPVSAQVDSSPLYKIVNPGQSIQEAINNATDGDTILISSGIYVEKSYPIIVNKSLTIIGENAKNTIINGNRTNRGIFLVKADYVKIGNLTIQNTTEYYGISGIHLFGVQYIEVFDCMVKNCGSGIQLTNSTNNIIARNNVTSNNSVGIYLHDDSSHNLIVGNLIANNPTGLWISDYQSSNNKIFHNSFVSNNEQQSSMGSSTVWDNGYPSGGNYWSDHLHVDLYHGVHQNISGSDGLVDENYMDIDKYPLVEPPIFVYLYTSDQDYYSVIITNSSISNFYFKPETGCFVNFTVQNDGNTGFCRVSIPKAVLWIGSGEQWIITLNETMVDDPFILEDESCTYFYLQYDQGTFHIKIQGFHVIPEIPSSTAWITLILFLTILFAAIKKLRTCI